MDPSCEALFDDAARHGGFPTILLGTRPRWPSTTLKLAPCSSIAPSVHCTKYIASIASPRTTKPHTVREALPQQAHRPKSLLPVDAYRSLRHALEDIAAIDVLLPTYAKKTLSREQLPRTLGRRAP